MKVRGLAAIGLLACLTTYSSSPTLARIEGKNLAALESTGQGSLQVSSPDPDLQGLCPLEHTDVAAEISGSLARVRVTQRFRNPHSEKIEAVYTFPLPEDAAVDDMTMTIGDRVVVGRIKRREEARAIYEAARSAGKVASLLDQERPNIFTQSVTNILPGAEVQISISYVELLPYEDGTYSFVFPMVVGPRYIPGNPIEFVETTRPNTDQVPDASRITPPVSHDLEQRVPTRAGHDISMELLLDAGVPLEGLRSKLHDVWIDRSSRHSAVIRLEKHREIPNRDFILEFDVAGRRVQDAILTHHDARGGFFSLVLQPPKKTPVREITPKELVFVIDTSGSMRGFPIEKAKETMALALDGLYPDDRFNLITFAGDTSVLFPEPVSASEENLRVARRFLETRSGRGGTEMMKAIRAALAPSDSRSHLRIVCFMTDGYVGNDMEIIAEVRRHPNARVFSFGIGNSVNRFLLDQMAKQGRGEVEYVTLRDDGSAAARRFHERVRNPLLTNIAIDWGGLPVDEIYPKIVPDLFSAKPLVVTGRYRHGSSSTITLRGKIAGRPFVREIPVHLPSSGSSREVLATLWARAKVESLMAQDYQGLQRGNPAPFVREQITRLGLDFRMMTQFTSFVAVEELTVTEGGIPRRIEVPVEMPDGVSFEGVFGDRQDQRIAAQSMANAAPHFRHAKRRTAKAESASSVLREMEEMAPSMPVPSKLHPALLSLLAIIEKAGTSQPADDAPFVENGKALIRVQLLEKTPSALRKLKDLGFQLLHDPESSGFVIGRLAVAQLPALAELEDVVYVAPVV